MNIVHLTSRLALVASMVAPDERVVDIGTDHGYLPIWLIQQKIVHTVIATDIHEKPLEKARHNIEKYHLQEQIQCMLSNGLEKITPESVDTIIIAGMGGDTMIEILEAAKWSHEKKLVLQPMSKCTKVRRYCRESGLSIVNEQLAEEMNRLYTVMTVSRGVAETLCIYDYASRALLTHVDDKTRQYLDRIISNEQKVLKGLQVAMQDTDVRQHVLQQLKLVRNELDE